MNPVKKMWDWLRAISGDDAYERYLANWAHRRKYHTDDPLAGQPLARAAYFKLRQSQQWDGVRRCC